MIKDCLASCLTQNEEIDNLKLNLKYDLKMGGKFYIF